MRKQSCCLTMAFAAATTAAWAGGNPVISLEADGGPCYLPGATLTVRVNLDSSPAALTSARLELLFDDARLNFVDIAPGADFVFESVAESVGAGTITGYTVGTCDLLSPPPGGCGPTGVMSGEIAVITFEIDLNADDFCALADLGSLVSFDPSPAVNPPTRLGEADGTQYEDGSTLDTNDLESATTTIDTTPPVLGANPSTFTVNVTSGNSCGAFVTIPALSVSDECDSSLTITRIRSDGLALNAEYPVTSNGNPATTITNTVTDDCGNQTVFVQTVFVNDQRRPTIVGCPMSVTVDADEDCEADVVITPPSAEDNCPGAIITSSRSDGMPLGAPYPLGVTTVTFVATDTSGNTNLTPCSLTVTVEDNTAPSFDCPDDIVVNNDPGACSALVDTGRPLTASDNCGDVAVTCERSDMAGENDPYPVGVTTVTCCAVDMAGNQTCCSFTVTVNDAEAPTLNCPPDGTTFTIDAEPGECFATVDLVSLAMLGEADNCDVPSLVWEKDDGMGGFDPIPDPTMALLGGIKTIRVTATDGSGNNVMCEFGVQVVDDQAPSITCPTPPASFACSSEAEAWVASNFPTVDDNCVPDESLKVTNDAPEFFENGCTTVTYQVAEPGNGLSNTCTIDICVADNTPPTLAGLPADDDAMAAGIQIIVCNDAGQCSAAVAEPNVTASDDCPDGVSLARDPLDWLDPFPVGTTTFTYTATDAQGNVTSETVQVIVNDCEAPTFNCPASVSIDVIDDLDCQGALVDLPTEMDLAPADNCGVATIEFLVDGSPISSPHMFPVGDTTVTVRVTDIHGNSHECMYEVSVASVVRLRIRVDMLGAIDPLRRCLDIRVERADMSCDVYQEEFNFSSDQGGAARRASKTLEIPCDQYEGLCISIDDPAHTLQRQGVISKNNAQTRYEADFFGSSNPIDPLALNEGLIAGDIANNDGFVDVGDFSVLVQEFGNTYASDITGCAANNDHADLDGDQDVDIFDFNLLNAAWLQAGAPGCCGGVVRNAADPQHALTIAQLIESGQGAWAIADINQDGVVDTADLNAFAANPRPQRRGDLNADDVVSVADISSFVVALTEGQASYLRSVPQGNFYTADVNADGRVTVSDISAFVQLLVPAAE